MRCCGSLLLHSTLEALVNSEMKMWSLRQEVVNAETGTAMLSEESEALVWGEMYSPS
ncbi:hypothetical protein TSMEX_007191 [Taenia solium]|eukprot:TsM_000137800 transcript=TsM_000137800 gene=TsM_000137800